MIKLEKCPHCGSDVILCKLNGIAYVAYEFSIVCDTHLGSGSSRIAAYDAGLDFVGCEIDPDYFKAQEERFQRHTAQENLFLQMEGKE